MAQPKSTISIPDVIKKGKKGFQPPPVPDDPTSVEAEVAHNRSQFAMNELTYKWPTLADLKIHASAPRWTTTGVKARIAELKVEHKRHLDKARKYREHEERKLVDEQYIAASLARATKSRDPERPPGDKVMNQTFIERYIAKNETDDFIDRIQYQHMKALEPLHKQLIKLHEEDEKARSERAKRFPASSQAWRQMDNPNSKFEVAKFLMSGSAAQEDILRRNLIWKTQMQNVNEVRKQYHNDLMFGQEVQSFVREKQTIDPRRRASAGMLAQVP